MMVQQDPSFRTTLLGSLTLDRAWGDRKGQGRRVKERVGREGQPEADGGHGGGKPHLVLYDAVIG